MGITGKRHLRKKHISKGSIFLFDYPLNAKRSAFFHKLHLKAKKGSIYSLEFMFSFLLAMIIICIMLNSLFSGLNWLALNQKEFELKRKALAVSEAIVKQNSQETPVLGSAYFNPLKHRVESNKIDLELFRKIGPNSLPAEFGELSELKIIFLDGTEITAVEQKNKNKKNCIAIERMILTSEIIPRKGKLIAGVCDG